jgi:hypothetical protein
MFSGVPSRAFQTSFLGLTDLTFTGLSINPFTISYFDCGSLKYLGLRETQLTIKNNL